MQNTLLKDIGASYGIADEFRNRFPDAAVLLHMSGRGDVRDYFPHGKDVSIHAPGSLPARLKNFSMPEEHEELFHALRRQTELFQDRMHAVFYELSVNAQIYGFDASMYPCPSRREGPTCFASISEIPEGHQSVILAYARAAGQVCLLMQNFASSAAVEAVKAQYKRVNELAEQGIHMPEGQIDLVAGIQEHASTPADQPLLQKGGPVGPVDHPIAFLSAPHIHRTFRGGSFLARSFSDGIFASDASAAFIGASDSVNAETAAALKMAATRSALRPEDIRSLTVAAVFAL